MCNVHLKWDLVNSVKSIPLNFNRHLAFAVSKWVDAEIDAGIPSDRIVIGGFSQGGSVALSYGIRKAEPKLGGLLAMSCWLPLHEKILADTNVSILVGCLSRACAGAVLRTLYTTLLIINSSDAYFH